VRQAQTDAEGRFVFEGLSNEPSTAWLVGARYRGVPFPGSRFTFDPDVRTREVQILIGEPTTDGSAIVVTDVELRVAWRGDHLSVTEQHRFENRGSRTVYLPADARAEGRAPFVTELPRGSRDFQVPLGIAPEGLVVEGQQVRFYGPIYPSAWPAPVAREQGITFEYSLPASGETLEVEKRFPSGARRLLVLAPKEGPPLTVRGAREDGTLEQEGLSFRRFAAQDVARGGALSLSIEAPPVRVEPAAVSVREVRVFLELDDAALQVREVHLLDVAGDTPVMAPPTGTLLALPLPAEARDLRFDRTAFERGLVADGQGGASLQGPLPPGETTVEISYHLPADPVRGAVLTRSFGSELPLLSVYTADTGVRLESDRLHRRRPVATEDRTFLHLEGFQVEPAETVRVALSPIAAPGTPSRAALFAVAALAAAAAAAFVGGPLRRAPAEGADEEEEDAGRHEREAVYAALRDLEHDHETSKVSDDDYATMRRELRTRAATLLRRAAEAPKTPTLAVARLAAGESPAPARRLPSEPPLVPAPRCPSCGVQSLPGDRFCAQCGTSLAPERGSAA
jgi:hypothetical protein